MEKLVHRGVIYVPDNHKGMASRWFAAHYHGWTALQGEGSWAGITEPVWVFEVYDSVPLDFRGLIVLLIQWGEKSVATVEDGSLVLRDAGDFTR